MDKLFTVRLCGQITQIMWTKYSKYGYVDNLLKVGLFGQTIQSKIMQMNIIAQKKVIWKNCSK